MDGADGFHRILSHSRMLSHFAGFCRMDGVDGVLPPGVRVLLG